MAEATLREDNARRTRLPGSGAEWLGRPVCQ